MSGRSGLELEAAALKHKIGNASVEDRIRIAAARDVRQEILNGQRSLLVEEFHVERAGRRREPHQTIDIGVAENGGQVQKRRGRAVIDMEWRDRAGDRRSDVANDGLREVAGVARLIRRASRERIQADVQRDVGKRKCALSIGYRRAIGSD